MQNPPPLVLTEAVHITAEAPPGMPIIPAIPTAIPGSGMFNSPNATRANAHEFNTHTQKVTDEFRIRTAQLPGLIEQELAATRLEGATHPLPPSAAIIRELGVRQLLISRKTAEYQQKTALANQFFGENPLNKNFHDYYMKVSHSRRSYLLGIANPWVVSYRAAHEAQLLSQSIQILNQQQVDVHKWLAAVQGNDQAQAAAAETRRQEAERARIAAEQQRQKDLAEKARREQEEIRVREQERLATLAEARRLAEELARTAAEAAARQVRAEHARLEALAEKHRQAEAENLRIERAYRTQQEQREHQREKALRAERAVIRQQARKNRRKRLLQAELEAQERRRAQAALDAEAEATRQAELARQKIKW